MKCLYLSTLAVICTFYSIEATNHCSKGMSHVLSVTASTQTINMSSTSYSPESTCEWLLLASPGDVIKVSLTRLDTECSWDRLYLYDGRSFKDKLLGVYSGSLLPRPVYARSGAVLIYFFSDSDGTATGFTIQYSLVSLHRDGMTPIGSIGSCSDDSECQIRGGIRNKCNRDVFRCDCQMGYSGVYCENANERWQLMGIGSQAMSRAGHRTANISDVVYLYGGHNYASVTSQLFRSFDQVRFEEIVPATSPAGRYSHQMAAQVHGLPLYLDYGVQDEAERFGDDALFVHGGVVENGSISDELWTFNVDNNLWSSLPRSPLAIADHVMVVIDNRWLLIHGGRTDKTDDSPISDMYTFDLKDLVWRKVKYKAGYEPSLRLAGHTAVLYNYLLYIYGGYTHANARFLHAEDVLWSYNVKEGIWSKVSTSGTGVAKPGTAFHSALLHDRQMYIYGGVTHTRTRCSNQLVYVFDLRCQSWSLFNHTSNQNILRALGQHGHSMLVGESEGRSRIYVYGGVQGSLTTDTIAIDTSAFQIKQSYCDPCFPQSTCSGCVLTAGCHWCAAERQCQAVGSRCSLIYWGDNSPLTNLTSCRTNDNPAGWFYEVYKYPVNLSQPDEVHLSSSTMIRWGLSEWDFVCDDCSSQLIARGYLFENPEESTGSVELKARRNSACAYFVSADGMQRLLGELPPSLPLEMVSASLSNDMFGDASGHILYDALQVGIDGPSPTATIGLADQFHSSGFALEFLKPFTRGNCSSFLVCLLCTADSLCGWCSSQSQCISRFANCKNDSDWLLTTPEYCESCESYTNCATCTKSSARCEWVLEIRRCLRRGRHRLSHRSPAECHTPCALRLNCTSCLDTIDECIWCTAKATCIPMDAYQLDYQYGQCLHYQTSVSDSTDMSSYDSGEVCSECSRLTTCKACSAGFFCGWCSNDADPIIGVCIPGDFSGPYREQICSEVVRDYHQEVGNATWYFRKCPDLLECTHGRHDCVPNAECFETLESYECHCSRGYKGQGNVSCEETCYHPCLNGDCIFVNITGVREYKCTCNLGWTGDACDIDCQCNHHATCVNGSGQCDTCYHNTTGSKCEQCVPNSYGDPTNSTGCTSCHCNGHGNPARQCDNVTGVCDCIHMSMGRDCSLCKPDYFGDPRDGGECFRCYHGRTIILNFSGTDNYGSRYCHPGIEFTSASMFMWHFETDDSSVPSHFLMFTLADFNSPDLNPVYIYDHQPNSVLSDAQPLAILTKKDIGRNISSLTGVLVVIHHGASFANEPMLKFKIAKRSCPTSCFGEESLCSSKDQCYCPLGTVWTICEGELFCFPFGNETNCGNTTDYMRGRSKSASSGNSQAIYIHGGVTAGGKLLDGMQVWNKSSSSLTLLGSLVSARYGHALECTEYACFLYGGITRDSSGSSRLAHIGSSSGDPFYINSQFYHLSLDTEPRGWTTLENKLVPPLTGHTLTAVQVASHAQQSVVLIGGMTEELIWSPVLYVYNNSKWSHVATHGAKPPGLVGHAAAYRSSFNSIYVLPGYTPNDDIGRGFYILDLNSFIWSRRQYALEPLASHYLFAFSDRYLVMTGGFTIDREVSYDKDTDSTLWVYDTSCDIWDRWWHPTSVIGNLERRTVVAYGISPPVGSVEGQVYAISSNDRGTLVSRASITLDFCTSHTDASLLPSSKLCEGEGTKEACTSDPAYCQALGTCDLCHSSLPDYGMLSSVCLWIRDKCVERHSFPFQDGGHECPTDACQIHTSCLSCTRTPGCYWDSSVDEIRTVFCTSTPTVDEAISSHSNCPKAADFSTCRTCLSSDSVHPHKMFSHSSARYLWNLSFGYCMVYDLVAILDVSHLGHVISEASDCPKNCSEFTQCITCHTQPGCGWCSVAESQLGIGLCMDGTSGNSPQCEVDSLRQRLEMEVVTARWNYGSCPEENECINGHHTCDLKVQKCVDKALGFECECRDGYQPLSQLSDEKKGQLCEDAWALPAVDLDGGVTCVPICPYGCGEQGCCKDENQCRCNLGYVGDQCEKECNCYGHSNCFKDDLSNCSQCQHNTTGLRCEFCMAGYVGDPTIDEDCMSCFDTCNRRSENCEGPQPNLRIEFVQCLDCVDNSKGHLCETCTQGYFVSENNSCIPCNCNGHGADGSCCPDTGSDCNCQNNTVSSSDSYMNQCDSCADNYVGTPTNNHQCYRVLSLQQRIFFGNNSDSAQAPLTLSQTAFFALSLFSSYGADIRLTLDIAEGAADIYIAETETSFTVRYDAVLNQQVIVIDQPESADSEELKLYKKRRSTKDAKVVIPDLVEVKEWDINGKYAAYYHFEPKRKDNSSKDGASAILKVTSVGHRLVVIFPKDGVEKQLYYVLLRSRASVTTGSLKFTQDSSKIAIFVFVNVFSSGLLLFLCTVAIGWKMRELQLIRRSQAVREVQLTAMADRPFAAMMMCMDTVGPVSSGACNISFNIVPLALEPINNSSVVVATTFMLLPGDETRPMKAAMASTLLTWKLSFPPVSKSKAAVSSEENEGQDAETSL